MLFGFLLELWVSYGWFIKVIGQENTYKFVKFKYIFDAKDKLLSISSGR